MKKNVIVFGLTAGVIVSAFMAFMVFVVGNCTGENPDFEGGMLMGYTAMLVAFSFVFVGIKNQRDKYNDGIITFGQGFKTGFFIALIASTVYVVTWLIEYYCFIPDFMDKYSAHMLKQIQSSGLSAAEIVEKTASINHQKEMYKNPIMVILFTYLEILPLGIIVSAISALILKRKSKAAGTAVAV